jgi:hypothetical protein
MSKSLPLSWFIVITLVGIPSVGSERPMPVSPGSPDFLAPLADPCPTFSWVGVAGAERYLISVYRLDSESEEVHSKAPESPSMRLVLGIALPGGAGSWTPPADRCLATPGRYLWLVTASGGGIGEVVSDPHLFELQRPRLNRELVTLLRILLAEPAGIADSPEDDLPGDAESVGVPGPRRGETTRVRPDSPTGVAEGKSAIRGELPDTDIETFGVVGVSHAATGAGVVAANTASGGADLVLEGDTPADSARLTEGGMDRPSSQARSFNFRNSGGGEMTLQVGGVAVTTSATDRDTLGGLSCDTNEVAQWNGASWVCVPMTGEDTLAGLSCGDNQIVHWNGSQWVCGQPPLVYQSCTDSAIGASCTMSCPAGTIVWTGGCDTDVIGDSLTESRPTRASPGQPPTGWRCTAWNPLGSSTVNGELYCVAQ